MAIELRHEFWVPYVGKISTIMRANVSTVTVTELHDPKVFVQELIPILRGIQCKVSPLYMYLVSANRFPIDDSAMNRSDRMWLKSIGAREDQFHVIISKMTVVEGGIIAYRVVNVTSREIFDLVPMTSSANGVLALLSPLSPAELTAGATLSEGWPVSIFWPDSALIRRTSESGGACFTLVDNIAGEDPELCIYAPDHLLDFEVDTLARHILSDALVAPDDDQIKS